MSREPMVSSGELVEHAGIPNRKTLYRWVKRGLLPKPKMKPYKFGKIGYYPEAMVGRAKRILEMIKEGYSEAEIAQKFERERMEKRHGGRKFFFDAERLNQLEEMAALQLTYAEIASIYKIDEDTMTRCVKEQPEVSERIKRGREKGKASLRRLQWKSASDGNVTMQVWLGKQWLNQTDKQSTELSGKEGSSLAVTVKIVR